MKTKMEKRSKHELDIEKKFKIEGLKILTGYDVYNMIVSAWEGGSSYWAYLSDKDMDLIYEVSGKWKGDSTVERFLAAVLGGVPIKIKSREDKDKFGIITKDSFAKAERLLISDYKRVLGTILMDEDDATTADFFFQLMVFGEVIYG